MKVQIVVLAVLLVLTETIYGIPTASDDIADEFVKKSLELQLKIAKEIKDITGQQIYVFDTSNTFADASIVVMANIRVLETKNKQLGVLSQAAQMTFSTSNQYKKFTNEDLHVDEVGLYI